MEYPKKCLTGNHISYSEDLCKKFNLWKVMYEDLVLNNKCIYEWIDTSYYRRFIQLFVDTGSGFSEESSIIEEVKPYTIQRFTFDLPEGIRNFRIDPLNEACALRLHKVTILLDDNSYLDITSLLQSNGFALDNNLYVFFSDDPQIWINNKNIPVDRAKKLNITLEYIPLNKLGNTLAQKLS
ncbi:MAG TPA: hypothetical protein DCG38_06665, partial [Eubacteriaceae bacterium]|nr:hypothetical protein [Eubacteriaceae bacterium]